MLALPNQVAFHEDPPLLWRHHYATHGNGIWFLAFSHYRMWPPSVNAMPFHSLSGQLWRMGFDGRLLCWRKKAGCSLHSSSVHFVSETTPWASSPQWRNDSFNQLMNSRRNEFEMGFQGKAIYLLGKWISFSKMEFTAHPGKFPLAEMETYFSRANRMELSQNSFSKPTWRTWFNP